MIVTAAYGYPFEQLSVLVDLFILQVDSLYLQLDMLSFKITLLSY